MDCPSLAMPRVPRPSIRLDVESDEKVEKRESERTGSGGKSDPVGLTRSGDDEGGESLGS